MGKLSSGAKSSIKKFIFYKIIFFVFYLQASFIDQGRVIASEFFGALDPSVIVPESTGVTLNESREDFGDSFNEFRNDPIKNKDSNQLDNQASGSLDAYKVDGSLGGSLAPDEAENHIDSSENLNQTDDETYFIVTAYYSPLPDQKYYFKGNYEDEVALNGRGIRGASGKKVFPGMLAGPKNYSFGTKIYLEGVGVGEISDRGSAIVSATGSESRGYKYDRLDIWMGYGEEGLKRALAWGKRVVKGKVLSDPNAQVSIDLSKFPAPDYVLKNLEAKQARKDTNPKFAIFDKYVGPESGKDNVIELQRLLSEIGFYSGSIDGSYQSVKESLINYQIKLGVINVKTDNGAGYFGPKTRAKAKIDYIAFLEEKAKRLEEQKKKEEEIAAIKENVKNKVEKHIAYIGSPKLGDVGKNVKALQRSLKALGYLEIRDDEVFGEKTRLGLLKYQLDKGIIKNKNDVGAGYFGPKTRESLKNDLVLMLEKYMLKRKNLLGYKAKSAKTTG